MAIDMPLTADAVAIYLGIVLAGCAAVSIADSFVAREIASRTRITRTKAIFTQVLGTCGWGMAGGPRDEVCGMWGEQALQPCTKGKSTIAFKNVCAA